MIQVPSTGLPYPTILYQTPASTMVNPGSGRWNLQNSRFLNTPVKTLSWSLIREGGVSDTVVGNMTATFNQQLRVTGVCNAATRIDPVVTLNNNGQRLESILKGYYTSNNVPDIVVLLLKTKNQAIYSDFKYYTDKIYVLQSICMTQSNMVQHGKGVSPQYMANIAMKANLKMAGQNHSAQGVNAWLQDTLVLGADVTHPGSGALEGTPSIAAVVGSIEANGGRFQGIMCLQAAKQEVCDQHLVLGCSINKLDYHRFHVSCVDVAQDLAS